MIKAENQKKRKPFTAQDTIPYKEIYKDGICRTDDNYYSKMVQFYDINYQLAQNDDKAAIFENYCEFLNSFDSSVEVQITFLNQQVNFDEYAKNIDIPEQDDCFNDIRKEYSDMLKMQLSKGNNGLVKTKYITFSIKADNLRNAKSRLERIEASVLNNFKVMGAMAEPLNGVERLKILHDVMNMDTKESFHFHYGMVAKTGLQTKDFIAPTGFDFRNDSYFRMGQTFGCVSYLQITSPELTDKLLADLLDLEENLIINMHLRPIDPKAAIKSLKSTLSNIQKMKIEEQKKAVRSGYDMDIIPTDISTYGEDVEGLLNEIQSRNEKLFELTFLLMNTADNKRKLDNIVYQTAGIAQKYNCNIRRLQYQQEQGLVASLPLGMNQTGIQRIMTTTSTAIFVPFTTQELFQGGEALYYGLNALSNNLIMVDRKRLKTPNGLILGTPGSGKSFATKREILNVFLITDDDIIICDPEGEYFPLVNALNGEVIKISAKSNDSINPMEVNLDVIYHPEKYRINGDVEDIDTIIADKAEFITSFCEVIMKKPQNAELNGDEVSMIDLCVKDIYKKYLYNDPKPENMPTLQDFYERLNFYAPDKPAAQNIANSLQLYVTGSQNVFTPNKGNLYKKLRQSRLKECHIVRYADDFKIFCRSYSDASKLKHAVEQWLMDRLKLETSPDKSRITNLTKGYSDFLGIKFKLYKKGKKWSIKSHMTDKAINSQRVKLKNAMAQACKSHESEQSQHDDLIRYNQAVIGMHQYYNMATMINADVHRLFPSIDITMKTRLNSRADLSKEKPPTLKGAMDEYFYQKYGESKQVRYINGMIVVPVAYCRTQNPMFYRVDTNRYTPQGRERIHRMLAKSEYGETLLKLSRDNDTNHSIEFCDNRLSRFVASKGKCELSKVSLAFEDVECIYLNPPSQGGTDEYANLRIVHKDIKSLIYSNDVKIIKSLIDLFDCRAPAKIAKLNKWRAKAGLEAINLITINQTLK